MDGNRLSAVPLDKTGWLPARVPGTVLTTLLENGLYPAPEFGLNNKACPSADTGFDQQARQSQQNK